MRRRGRRAGRGDAAQQLLHHSRATLTSCSSPGRGMDAAARLASSESQRLRFDRRSVLNLLITMMNTRKMKVLVAARR